jgi:ArsR family transcriptional regulator, arsenate/arsenite/antimonite-responsive transcriptional repressor
MSKRRSQTACCPSASKSLAATGKHVAAFKALAHPGRLSVFFHLVQAGKALPVNEIQTALRLPAPTLSHHLDHLERANLIIRRKDERYIFSEVDREVVVDLVRLLTACC